MKRYAQHRSLYVVVKFLIYLDDVNKYINRYLPISTNIEVITVFCII